MSYNYDFTRKNGVEVMVTYYLRGSGDYDDPFEVEFDKIYGLPDGQDLTEKEYQELEEIILADPPEYQPLEDDVI